MFRRLAAVSDVVIENFGAGVMTNWGCSYDDLLAQQPAARHGVALGLRPYRAPCRATSRTARTSPTSPASATSGGRTRPTATSSPPRMRQRRSWRRADTSPTPARACSSTRHRSRSWRRWRRRSTSTCWSTASASDASTDDDVSAVPTRVLVQRATTAGRRSRRRRSTSGTRSATSSSAPTSTRPRPTTSAARVTSCAMRSTSGPRCARRCPPRTSSPLAGVPAASVANTEESYHDPQLHHRHFPTFVDHPDLGFMSNPGTPYRLSVTPGEHRPRRPSSGTAHAGGAPALGRHVRHRGRRAGGRGRRLRPRGRLTGATGGQGRRGSVPLWTAGPARGVARRDRRPGARPPGRGDAGRARGPLAGRRRSPRDLDVRRPACRARHAWRPRCARSASGRARASRCARRTRSSGSTPSTPPHRWARLSCRVNPAMGEHELEQILASPHPISCSAQSRSAGSLLGDRLQTIVDRLPHPARSRRWTRSSPTPSPRCPTPTSPTTVSCPVLVQYTSGTSGRPKGAVITHAAAVNIAANFVHGWGHGPDDVLAGPLPLHHVAGTIGGLLANLTVGASFAFLPAYEPTAVIRLVEATDATVLAAVPTMLYDLQRQPGSTRIGSRRSVSSSVVAPPCPSPPCATSRRRSASSSSSPTGRASRSASRRRSRAILPTSRRARSDDRIPGREVKIADPETSEPVPVGHRRARSASARRQQMTHYLGMPEATAATIDADGWLHTGDLGSMDDAGNITFRGRARRDHPRRREHLPRSGRGRVHRRARARRDRRRRPRRTSAGARCPVGVVVLAGGAPLDERALEDHGRRASPVPGAAATGSSVDELPLTASGKVRKVELELLVRQLLDDDVT